MNRTQFWQKVMETETYRMEQSLARVGPLVSCPNCHEDRKDFLVWTDDGAGVICQSCGKEYTPGYTGHR